VAIIPGSEGSEGTRILITDGPGDTLLKAKMPCSPAHPRAIPGLLEALALWMERPVRAVLAADARSISCASTSWLDGLDSCRPTPLYTIRVVARLRPRREELRGLGSFRELRELLVEEVAL
jgi:hypothetical protein